MRSINRNRFGIVFVLLGGVLGGLGFEPWNLWLRLLVLSAGLGSAGLGLAYLLGRPALLGKTGTGRLRASSYLFFWPYHLLNYGSLLFFRLCGVVPFQEIVPGLYLGGRLLAWEQNKIQTEQWAGVLDLTCEFCEVRFFRRAPAYLCIPLLDGSAPSPSALAAGLEFIRDRLQHGPVYVHCAMGHGRGATFVAGYLLATGRAANVPEAVAQMRSKRPGVRLRAEQVQALEQMQR